MSPETRSARDIVAAFIADVSGGKHDVDSALAAVLLEHLLLQGGYKIVPRQPDDKMLMAANIGTTTPDEVWSDMWDAAGDAIDGNTGYVPA